MPDTAPLVEYIERTVPSVGAAADSERDVGVAKWAATVTAVEYVPDTVLTGANTDSRTVVLVNKGQSGAGTTIVATLAFVSAVNAAADDSRDIPVSGTAANLVLAAGDVLAWQSTHVGSTGLADPGGLVRITVTRS